MMLALYIASFLFQLSGNSMGTFLPLFAKSLGASYTGLGIIGFASSTSGVIVAFSFGRLARRVPARRLLLLSAVIGMSSIALLNVARSVLDVIVLQVCSGIGNGLFFPIADAFASEVEVPESREKVLGRYSASWGGSLLVGPLIGASVMSAVGFRNGVLFAALIGFAALMVVVVGLLPGYSTRPLRIGEESPDTHAIRQSVYPLVVITIANQFAYGAIFSLFPVYASGHALGLFEIGSLFSLYALVRLIFFLSSHRIARLGVLKTLGMAIGTLCVPLILVAGVPDYPVFLLAFALIGVSSGLFFPTIINLFAWARADRGMDAQMGFFESFSGIGSLVGSAVGGVVADTVSPSAPYYFSGGVVFLLVPLIFRARRIEQPQRPIGERT